MPVERREIANSIIGSWRFLERVGLAESFAYADPLPVNTDFRDLIFAPDSGHLDLYRYCLRNSYYNFMVFDHSFFQFGWSAPSDVRYAYYPNPHVSRPDALHKFRRYREMVREETLSEDEFSQLVQGMKFDGGVPIFRYEHSPSQYVPLSHPCSHLHIGVHGDNRWAVSRLLSPLAFTMLMVKHYYPAEWAQGAHGDAGAEVHDFEIELSGERSRCPLLGEAAFCQEERNTFHFA
jgi:hypothetical protein